MLRKTCSKTYYLASRPSTRHLINVQRPDIRQLRGAETGRSPVYLTSRGFKSSTPACKLAVAASHGSPLDDVDATMDEIRGRLASIESMQQQQLDLQRGMADDMEALHEELDGFNARLTLMTSLMRALTKVSLASQERSEGTESTSRSEQPSQPEASPEQSAL